MFSVTILTAAERVILQTRLDDARSAYHQLMTGTAARVIVDQNGERVEFATANRGNLANYILSLEVQLATSPVGLRAMAPAQFVF